MFKKVIKLLILFSLFLGIFRVSARAADYYPIGESLLNNTSSLSGTTGDLQVDDTNYRILRSFPAAYTSDYQTTAVDAVSTMTSTTYADKASITWTVPSSGDYLIYSTAEIKRTSTTALRTTKAQLLIDGVSYAESFVTDDSDVDNYRTFSGVEIQTLSAGSHTIKIQYATTNANNTATIRNARISIMRIGNHQFNAPGNGSTNLTSYTDIATLTFTPKVTEDWLIMANGDITSSSTSALSYANLMMDSTQLSEGVFKTIYAAYYMPFNSYKTVTLTAGTSYTFKIQMKTSTGTLTFKNVDLYAIPKSIFRTSASAENIGVTSCSTCTAASPTTIATLNLNTGIGGTYLVTATGEQANNSLTVYSGIRLNIGTSVAQSIVDVGNTLHWAPFSLQNVVSLSTGTTTIQVQLYTQTSGTAVRARDVRIQAIKLGAASGQKLEVEYSGVGNTSANPISWLTNSAFSNGSVGTTLQLWNYNSGTYPTTGDGFLSYASNGTANTFEEKTQSITSNPTYFRNSSTGAWKIKVLAQTTSPTWIDWSGDVVKWSSIVPPPNTPTNSSPTNNAVGQSLNSTLVGSTFSDPSSDTHASSQWQVYSVGITTTTVNGGYFYPAAQFVSSIIGGTEAAGGFTSTGENFSVDQAIDIAGVALKFNKIGSPTDIINVDFIQGITGGTVLASGTIPAASISTDATVYNIIFNDIVSLSVGTTYMVRITRSPDVRDATNYINTHISNAGFARGQLTDRYNNAWQTSDTYDLYFGLLESNKVWDSGITSTNKTSVVVNTTNGTFSGSLSGQTSLNQGTEYFWKVKYKNSNNSWSSYSSSTTFTTIFPPYTPTNATPVNGAGDQSINPTLTSSSFSDPDPSDTHANSQWQVFGLGGSGTETSVTGGFYYPTPSTHNTVIGGASTTVNRVQSNGQSFNLSTGITAVGVLLNLAKVGSPTDSITVSLLSGSITGTVLASGTLPASQLTTTDTNYHVNFTSSANLNSGTTYYIRISRTPDTESTSNYVTVSGAATGSVFTQGTLYYKYNNVWSADSGDDLYFSILEPGYNEKVWDSGTTSTNKTSVVVNTTNGTFSGSLSGQTALASTTSYSWQVRHQDNNGLWSNYSSRTLFTVATLGPKANQNHFRWRDDSTVLNTNSGWLANEDVGYTGMIKDNNYRLRLEIANDGNGPLNSQQFRLEYASKNGAVCGGGDETFVTVPVTATNEAFEMINSSQYANGDTISSSFLTSTGTFVSGKAIEDPSNASASIGITNAYYSEFEYAIKPTTSSVGGVDYCFRVTDVGSTANFIYSLYSEARIQPIPNTNQSSFRWRNDDGGEMIAVGETKILDVGVTYYNGYSLNSPILSDVNGDNKPDLIGINGNNIIVFFNDGQGNFGVGSSYVSPQNSYPTDITSADMNNDGLNDVITNNESSLFTIFLNTGSSNTFGVGTTYISGSYFPTDIISGDFNNDGLQDISCSDYDPYQPLSTVSILLNNGNGTFSFSNTYNYTSEEPSFLASGDFNLDGLLDIVAVNSTSNNITVFENSNVGTSFVATNYSIGVSGINNIIVQDFNTDGKLDIIYGFTDGFVFHQNSGTGTFNTGVTIPSTGSIGSMGPVSADLNIDGKPDIVLNNAVYFNDGSGNFATGVTIPSLTNASLSSDLNQDGRPDIITADTTSNSFSIYLNSYIGSNNYGTFGTAANYSTSTGSYPWDIIHGDFNNDGKEDFATANGALDKISVFLNTGNGTYGTGVTYASLNEPAGITSADFNRDGYLDLATANRDNTSIFVYLNDGDGTFATGVSYATTGATPYDVSSGDVNNDGYPDIISANFGSDNLTVFINDRDGTFATGATYSTVGDGPRVVTVVDADKDGYLDLASGNYNDGSLTVLINDRDGTYGTGTTYPSFGSWIYSITSADFNQDGYFDLSTANQASGSFTVFINDGDGTYATGVTYPTVGTDPRAITSADFNRDGKIDLAVGLQGNDNVNVFFNDGDGTFSIGASYPVNGTDPYSITSADVNNDGNPDIATSNFYSENITVLTNISTSNTFGASWKAAENIGITNVNLNTNLRLRFSVKNTFDFGTFNFRLQVAPKGESAGCTGVPSVNFSDVPTTVGSAVAVMTTSPEFSDQSSTTNQLTDSSNTFIAGKMVEHSSNQTNSITLSTNQFTEVEYNFQMTSNASGNTPYCFRVVNVGSTLNNYSQIAQLTTSLSNQPPSAPYLPYVDNDTARTGQQTPVYGLIDHTPAFSAVFDDSNTSDTSSYYQLQIGSDTDWASAEIWDSAKTSIGSTCNENSRCADIVYGGGTSLVDGSTYYWRIKFWDNSDTEGSWSDTQQFSMNSKPSISTVVINNNNSIDLSENSSIGISWTSTATDPDGYTNLSSATGKIYRSGLGSTCTLDNNNCYSDASCDFYNCSDNSCSVLCSANLYFFTEATDTGSTYADQYYQAWVEATDLRTEVGSTISTSTSVDVNSMRGFSIGSSLVYGEVFAGSDTGSSNTVTTITNTGNSLINLEVTGDYMCTDYPSCGGQSIEPQNQQFKLSSFVYGTGTTLSTAPQVVNIGISKPTQTPSNSFKNLYWGIGIPSSKTPGNYQGATTILVY